MMLPGLCNISLSDAFSTVLDPALIMSNRVKSYPEDGMDGSLLPCRWKSCGACLLPALPSPAFLMLTASALLEELLCTQGREVSRAAGGNAFKSRLVSSSLLFERTIC